MKDDISQLIQRVLNELSIEDSKAVVTPTDDPTHGDYSTNVAFQVTKKLGKSPIQTAEMIVEKLRSSSSEFEKIEVAAPGFINFTLRPEVLIKSLLVEHKKLASPSFSGQKIMIEFTDPNPFKEFHIGHLYSNIVGESISRLLEATGAEVKRVCYQGDVGLHVAKALYGMQQKMSAESLTLANLEGKDLNSRAKFLGESYALGATAFEEDETAKQEITHDQQKSICFGRLSTSSKRR